MPCTFRKGMCGSGGIAVLILGFDSMCGEWLVSRPGYFTPGKTCAVLVKEETVWAPEPFWTPCTREKSFISSKEWTTIPCFCSRCTDYRNLALDLYRKSKFTGRQIEKVGCWKLLVLTVYVYSNLNCVLYVMWQMASFICNLCSYGEIISCSLGDWRYEGKYAIRPRLSWNGMLQIDAVKYWTRYVKFRTNFTLWQNRL